jgi:glutamate formiminotransferase
VVNVSEGRSPELLDRLADAAGPALVDLHRDPHHHRSVFTLVGEPDAVTEAARALATRALDLLDLRTHAGVHPRTGVVDVVPFVPYAPGAPPPGDLTPVLALRDGFARWLGLEMGIPTYLYGPASHRTDRPARTLPEVRRLVGDTAAGPDHPGSGPDFGPPLAVPRTGVSAVGARPVLVAYNVWVSSAEVARAVAPRVRSVAVRALGLATGQRAQVSCNLVEPSRCGPATLYDTVSALAAEVGGAAEGGELVGLLPHSVLAAVPTRRWSELGLSADSTVESRLSGR